LSINKGLKRQEVYLTRANLYFEKNIYDNAINDYSILIEQFRSKDYNVFISRGVCYSMLNKTAEAIKDFSKAITLNQNKAEAYYLRGSEYYKLGKTKEPLAIKDFNKAIELEPDNNEAYIKRGIYFLEKQKYTEALDDFNKSIKIKANSEAYYYKGATLYELKKYNEACIELKKSAQMGYEQARKKLNEICPN